MTGSEIIPLLPYEPPFLFVDDLTDIQEYQITGNYRFREDEYFYRGHFKDAPVTPGVILVECMAQIGLVCHGLFLLNKAQKPLPSVVAFTAADVDFLIPVYPGEKVEVKSQLIYFRMGKIKSQIILTNASGVACRGELSGMLRS